MVKLKIKNFPRYSKIPLTLDNSLFRQFSNLKSFWIWKLTEKCQFKSHLNFLNSKWSVTSRTGVLHDIRKNTLRRINPAEYIGDFICCTSIPWEIWTVFLMIFTRFENSMSWEAIFTLWISFIEVKFYDSSFFIDYVSTSATFFMSLC